MDFSLSPEHKMTQKMVRDFAQKEIAPVIKEYDRKQEPIPFMLKRMGELGILGICFPTRYGGQGMDYLSLLAWPARNSKRLIASCAWRCPSIPGCAR
jgi:glutaryl-CoA dehydrogenase (non-decarboxylating)